MSIEVLDGQFSAGPLAEGPGGKRVQAAVLPGAVDWTLHHHRWGVVLELSFTDEQQWERFRADAAVEAALDAVPDPDGVLIYRGRGGSSSPREPRRPRPMA